MIFQLVSTAGAVLACTACVGDPTSNQTRALAFGILALLAVLAPVQLVIVRFFWRLLEAEERSSQARETAT